MVSIHLTELQRDTILAALRHYQREFKYQGVSSTPMELLEIASCSSPYETLTEHGIDSLCSLLKTSESPNPKDRKLEPW
jgi:hypothetical protein